LSEALSGCLWAAAVTLPAASAGFAAITFAKSLNLSMSSAALSAGAIRLLLIVVGCAIIPGFAAVPALWFLAWLGFFYVVTLVAEVYFAILIVNKQKEQRLVTSWD
jgi:hypothetical protein